MSEFATGGLYVAPLGTSLTNTDGWTALGHTIDGFELSGWGDVEHGTWGLTETLAERTASISFTAKRRDIRRMIKMLSPPRSLAEMRRSARWVEYRRRTRHR